MRQLSAWSRKWRFKTRVCLKEADALQYHTPGAENLYRNRESYKGATITIVVPILPSQELSINPKQSLKGSTPEKVSSNFYPFYLHLSILCLLLSISTITIKLHLRLHIQYSYIVNPKFFLRTLWETSEAEIRKGFQSW